MITCPVCLISMTHIDNTRSMCPKCDLIRFEGADIMYPGYQKGVGDYVIDWFENTNECKIHSVISVHEQYVEYLPLDITLETLKLYMSFS